MGSPAVAAAAVDLMVAVVMTAVVMTAG